MNKWDELDKRREASEAEAPLPKILEELFAIHRKLEALGATLTTQDERIKTLSLKIEGERHERLQGNQRKNQRGH